MSTIRSLDRVSGFVITIYMRYVPAVSRFRNFFFSRDFLFLEASRPFDEPSSIAYRQLRRVASRRVALSLSSLVSFLLGTPSLGRKSYARNYIARECDRESSRLPGRRFDPSFLIYRFFLRRPPVSLAMARYTTPLPLPTVAPTTNSTNNTATPPRQDNEDGTHTNFCVSSRSSLSLSLSLSHKKRGAAWRGVALLHRD